MQVTAMLGRKSLSGFQDAPPSVVFQMPPSTAPAYMMFAFVGSITSARVRPPTLPGPRFVHVPSTPAELPPAIFGVTLWAWPFLFVLLAVAAAASASDGASVCVAVEYCFICFVFPTLGNNGQQVVPSSPSADA